MTYRIKYNYDTGDSFNTHTGCEDFLELTHQDLEVAKSNIRRIGNHYKMYKELNRYSLRRDTKEDILARYRDEDWFVKDGEYSSPEYCLILKTDKGKDLQICADWVGYFETLNYVEIVPDETDMKIYM